jgi:glutamate--cysteine ligase
MPSPTRSLSRADVRRFVDEEVFASREGPVADGRVGIELEWIVVPRDAATTPSPLDLAALLPAALPGGSRVTFEPGGQLELSGPVATGLRDACQSMRADTAAVRDALAAHDLDLVGTGVDTRGDVPRVLDAPRYQAMEQYFDDRGPAGRTMMRHTASIQVNLDVGHPAQVDARWQLAHDLAPVLIACFANSPFDTSGAPSGFRSTRSAVWHDIDPARTDPARTGPARGLPVGDAAGDWSRYLLAAPVMMIRVDERVSRVPTAPLTFAHWVDAGHRDGWPTVDDLAYHLTTLFPPVRPRGWLELRMIDALPDEWWPVAVAVTTALLDDPVAAARASSATAAVRECSLTAARAALHDPALARAAVECFTAARGALDRLDADDTTRAATEEYFDRFVARGRCPADEQLDDWSRLQAAGV